MSYEYVTFDDIALPPYWRESDLSTGEVESTLLDTIGGTFDAAGNDVRLPKRSPISLSGVYTGEVLYLVDHLGNHIVDHLGNRIIAGSASNHLRTQLEPLRQRLGKRALLYRRRLDDLSPQWKRAKLMKFNHQSTVNDREVIAHVALKFDTEQAGWHSATLKTDTLTIATLSSPLVTNVGGTAIILDAILTVTAASPITNLRIIGSGIDFSYTGVISAAGVLVMDAIGQTIRNSGVDAYADLNFNAGHTARNGNGARAWLPLYPGVNTLTVISDGSGTASISYYDQWL